MPSLTKNGEDIVGVVCSIFGLQKRLHFTWRKTQSWKKLNFLLVEPLSAIQVWGGEGQRLGDMSPVKSILFLLPLKARKNPII